MAHFLTTHSLFSQLTCKNVKTFLTLLSSHITYNILSEVYLQGEKYCWASEEYFSKVSRWYKSLFWQSYYRRGASAFKYPIYTELIYNNHKTLKITIIILWFCRSEVLAWFSVQSLQTTSHLMIHFLKNGVSYAFSYY